MKELKVLDIGNIPDFDNYALVGLLGMYRKLPCFVSFVFIHIYKRYHMYTLKETPFLFLFLRYER